MRHYYSKPTRHLFKITSCLLIAACIYVYAGISFADNIKPIISVPMNAVNAKQLKQSIGNITLEQTGKGVIITPKLQPLAPGTHSFRRLPGQSCQDIINSPPNPVDGNKKPTGFLAPLFVNKNAQANSAVIAPQQQLNSFNGQVLVIYNKMSDNPDQLFPTNVGTIVACGVIPKAENKKSKH